MTQPTKQIDFIDGVYNLQIPVETQKFDAIRTFFLSRTKGNTEAANSLTTAFLEIATNQGIDPMALLDQFRNIKDNNSLRIALIALFNETRPNTSKIGFSQRPVPNPIAVRNLR